MTAVPPRPSDDQPAAADLRDRLQQLGYEVTEPGSSQGGSIADAVAAFQRSRGLEVSGECDDTTWRAIVEAGFTLGDRLLCLTSPNTRGDDVAELQLRLGSLGFDSGRTDGIFGPDTQRAVQEFQQNVGVVSDAICGPETVETLERLATRGSNTSVAGIREREQLRGQSLDLIEMNIVIAHTDEEDRISGVIGSALHERGANVAVMCNSDWSELAHSTNEFDAQVCLAIVPSDDAVAELAYFSTDGFTSTAGKRLADALAHELPTSITRPPWTTQGKRLPILRETRPAAVRCKLGPPGATTDEASMIAAGVIRGISRWSAASD